MIKNKLLYFLTERAFNRALSTPGIEDTSIAFVGDEDNKFIYTHGTKFNSGGASTSDIESVVEQYIDGLYGEIKDQFYTKEQADSLLNTKQPTLVSGTNIKTINGRSLLGSGDIVIEADGEDPVAYIAGPGINIEGTVISLTNANSSAIGGIKTGYTTNDRNYAVKLDSENRAYVTVPWAVPTTIEGKAGGHWQIIFKVSERQPTLPIDFDSNNEGWGSTAANTGIVWMADRFVEGDGTAGAWQGPWRISGPDGEAGVDGDQFEYIYKRTTSETAPTGQDSSTPSASGSGSTPADDDFVPANWNDNPTGVDVVYKYEWVSLRKKHNGTWSAFSGPVLWSAYGRLGTDGDGVEYIYYAKANVDFPDTDPNTWTSDADFQDREYIRSGSGWTDDPVDLSTYPQGTKQFVSVRKKYANSTDSEPYWHAYSAPALWSYYATDGAVVGDAPVVYTIQVVQSTMAKAYGDTDTLTGKIAYRILRTQGLQREFISSSNSYGISTTVYLGSNTSKPLTSTYNSANGYWETSQLRSTVWSDDCEFSEIVVIEKINSTNTIVAAAVVPTIIPGLNGKGSSVDIQSLNLVVTRMRGAWASGETYSDGKSRAENGVFYKDIVQYNNDYYVCLSQGTSNPPTTVVDGETVYSPDWGLLPLIGAAALETLLANSAYIKSLTANQVIVTREINGIEVPVTGLVNGTYIPKDVAGNNTTGNGVRIFAGTIPENGNLADTAFNVDEEGKVKAEMIAINGDYFQLYMPNLNQSDNAANSVILPRTYWFMDNENPAKWYIMFVSRLFKQGFLTSVRVGDFLNLYTLRILHDNWSSLFSSTNTPKFEDLLFYALILTSQISIYKNNKSTFAANSGIYMELPMLSLARSSIFDNESSNYLASYGDIADAVETHLELNNVSPKTGGIGYIYIPNTRPIEIYYSGNTYDSDSSVPTPAISNTVGWYEGYGNESQPIGNAIVWNRNYASPKYCAYRTLIDPTSQNPVYGNWTIVNLESGTSFTRITAAQSSTNWSKWTITNPDLYDMHTDASQVEIVLELNEVTDTYESGKQMQIRP